MDENTLYGILGVAAGALGFAAAIGAVIWGMGFREYLGGKKRNLNPVLDAATLRKKLKELNSPELPFKIQPSEETDYLVEWNIADAAWFALFAKERLKKTYRAYLVLDDFRKTVRYHEQTASVRWVAGVEGAVPHIAYQSEFFRGRILFQKSMGVEYALKPDLTLGKVYEYKFDVARVRDPIKKLVLDSGWEFVPVVRKLNATFKSLKYRA